MSASVLRLLILGLAAGQVVHAQSSSGSGSGSSSTTSTAPSPTGTAVCDPATDFGWSFNSRDQSPCVVTSYLGGACNNGVFEVPALGEDEFYSGVRAEFRDNKCRCSSVYYSVLSACGACQGNEFLRWSTYKENCSAVFLTVFPEPISPGTSVPAWAYADVTLWDMFNETAARGQVGLPESTGSEPPTASLTNPGSNPTTSRSPNPSQTGQAQNQDSGGAGLSPGGIAGAVIGSILGVGLIVFAIWYFLRRRRDDGVSKPAPGGTVDMSQHLGGQSPSQPSTFLGYGHGTQPSYSETTPHKYYDPSDPSTYPTTPSTMAVASPHSMNSNSGLISPPHSPGHPPSPNYGVQPPSPNYGAHPPSPNYGATVPPQATRPGYYSGMPEV